MQNPSQSIIATIILFFLLNEQNSFPINQSNNSLVGIVDFLEKKKHNCTLAFLMN